MSVPGAPQSPDRAAIQRLAATVMKTKIVSAERLDGYLQRVYQLSGAGGSFCLMKCSPAPGVRVLSIEEDRLGVEASVLSLLSRRVDIAAPKLLEYQAATNTLGSSYIIVGPYSGSIMSFAGKALSASDRIDVDRSLGVYYKRLTSLTHSSFGPFRRPILSSWAKYFAVLLETVLRDGEDSLINLPYDNIREMLRKHWQSIDAVTQPKLVLLEVCSTENIVVDERTKEVTSLVDYSTAIWGDPFISDSFHRPSRSFLEGYGEGVGGDNDKRIRHLFYISFHSLLAIVRQKYRPQTDSHDIESRKALLTALRYLEQIPVL
ncbi:hypothetical protein AMS68_005690 [Peltaster fructicola]|uniref:Aminoglycoside phosphotransferase domain-containing protein n=1 Tax=Peltaster fructicola TaxID=286661 RepID=A0A6H0XZJ3_9PEZI|nr:hypothetical protein AMS68_005690 [Peltaster fructicola]